MRKSVPPSVAPLVIDPEPLAGEEPVPPSRLQPGTPRDLETICLKCLEKEAGKRYQSAAALAEELRKRRLENRRFLAVLRLPGPPLLSLLSDNDVKCVDTDKHAPG